MEHYFFIAILVALACNLVIMAGDARIKNKRPVYWQRRKPVPTENSPIVTRIIIHTQKRVFWPN